MIFEVLKWDGRCWLCAGLLVGGVDRPDAWATLKVLGVAAEYLYCLRCVR
jgi:hypothetical protein